MVAKKLFTQNVSGGIFNKSYMYSKGGKASLSSSGNKWNKKKKPTSVKVEEKLNIYNWKQRMTYRLEEIIQNEKEKIKDIKYAYE